VLLAADCAHADSTFFHQDDFRSYPKDSDGSPAWETLGISWTAGNGRFECVDPGKDFALLSGSPWGELGHFEVTLVLKESISSDWGVAGLGFCVDRDHYWHYAFVEQPDEKGKGRFVELLQFFPGSGMPRLQVPLNSKRRRSLVRISDGVTTLLTGCESSGTPTVFAGRSWI